MIPPNSDEQVSVAGVTAALVTRKPVSSALRWKAADPVVFHLLNRFTFYNSNISETDVDLMQTTETCTLCL